MINKFKLFLNLLLLMLSMLFCANLSAATTPGVHWGYQGKTGPNNWAKLSPAFATCGIGRNQSPIDIQLDHTKVAKLGPIQFHYRLTPLDLIDNGHTIQLNYKPGSKITVHGETYNLLQLHFHVPSENQIDGKSYAMEMHLVQKSDSGKLVVVAVLFKVGKYNSELAKLWKHLPSLNKKVINPKILINAINLIPKEHKDYYFWMGSLTTPPCSENVAWYLLQKPTELSRSQIRKFVAIIGHNDRPIQPLNGRVVEKVNLP